jgi:uncharacterized repeat protein (TIGR03833 family)
MFLFTETTNYLFNNTLNSDIYPGTKVLIVLKKDQKTGKLTEGIVKDILTSKSNHTRGIKVRLEDGQVGRVQKILSYSNNNFLPKLENLLLNHFNDLPYCLVTPDFVYWQNTKLPEPGVKNTVDNIYKYNKKFKDIKTIKGWILEKKYSVSEIREKTKQIINFLKENKISFFFVTKQVSATSNNDSSIIKLIRDKHKDWEKKNGYNPDESWD